MYVHIFLENKQYFEYVYAAYSVNICFERGTDKCEFKYRLPEVI
jgi:hypothetical protein